MTAARGPVLALLLASLTPVSAAGADRGASDSELRIEGILGAPLPRTEPARSARLVFLPHVGDLRRSDYLRTAIGLRYGLTEHWEAVTEVDWFMANGLGTSPLLERSGLSSLHLGTKYRVGRFRSSDGECAIGADFQRPLDRPPPQLTDGLQRVSPYVTFSRPLPGHPAWRVFWGAGHSFIAPTSTPGERRRNEFSEDYATFSAGFVHARGAINWTFEIAHDWRTDASGDGRWIVRPGLVWMIPPRFTFGSTGRWLLGGAVQFTRGPDGSDVRVSAKVRGNFDFLRLIGGRRSPEKPSGAK
jgi:hypothetical protein